MTTTTAHMLVGTALAAYAAGLALGAGVAWAAWTSTSHEHRWIHHR